MNIKFIADHHFVIGQEHISMGKPCQDHALSFAEGLHARAVIADGCGSGGETDMGARLLTFTTIAAFRESLTLHDNFSGASLILAEEDRLRRLEHARQFLQLSREDLLATSGYVSFSHSLGYVALSGDGVIAWKYRSGRVRLARFDWARNMPCYPIYADDGHEVFRAAHADDPYPFFEEHWSFSPQEGWCFCEAIAHTLDEGISGARIVFSSREIDELVSVALFTDGVLRIEGIDWKDAVLELLAFKNMTGEFAKRRMNRALTQFRLLGKGPLDDLAYAVIGIVHIEGEDYETDRESKS